MSLDSRYNNALHALIAMAVIVASIAGLYILSGTTIQNEQLRHFLENIANIVLITTAFSLVWNLFSRRRFSEELFANWSVASTCKALGVYEHHQRQSEIRWSQLLENAKEIDLFFIYARSWRSQYESQLADILSRRGSRIRVVLPDPGNKKLMESLGERFGKDKKRQIADITGAMEFLQGLSNRAKASGSPGKMQVWYTRAQPVFSYYRFDNSAVVALYPHKEKIDLPHFVCKYGGDLFEFAKGQFETLVDENDPISQLAFSSS